LLNGSTNDFELASSWNLPEGLSTNNLKKWSDWINTSTVISGKTLLIQESLLQQLEMDSLGRSAVIVPIKLDQKVIGSFLLVREMDVPFEKERQTYLKVLSDYASISLGNIH
jgi:transcriptional regulator with GAF, ATPase, and Fis domain